MHEPVASYCDVTMTDCSYGFLWTRDVEVGEFSEVNEIMIICGAVNWLAGDIIILYIVGELFFTAHLKTEQFMHFLG